MHDPAAALLQLRRLKLASVVEATTLVLLLCVAVPLKHLGGWETGVRLMGPVHGFAFLCYLWMVLQTTAGGGWARSEVRRLILAAFFPFGGFANLGLLARKAEQLQRAEAAL